RIGKGRCQRIHRLHHQVHIDRHGHTCASARMGLEGLADHGTKREVGHVVVVHHVKVDPVRASVNDAAHFVTQAGEIGGQNRGGDTVGAAHGSIVAVTIPPCQSTSLM